MTDTRELVERKFTVECNNEGDAMTHPQPATPAAIDMLLFCPMCGEQHIDSAQPEKNWANPPHRSHECQFCGHVWRPADVPTNGVISIKTKGRRDGTARPRGFYTDLDTKARELPTSTETLAFNDTEPLVLWEERDEIQCEAVIYQGEVEFTNTGLTLGREKARALRDWLTRALGEQP